MKHGLLSQLARALGLQRAAPVPPFGAAWIDEAPTPRSDRPILARPGLRSFTDVQKCAVWAKAQPIIGWDPQDWRVDHRGNPIFRQHYRDSASSFGWEIARIDAEGADDVGNWRPQLCHSAQAVAARVGLPLDLDPYVR